MPPYPEIGSGESVTLLVRNDTFIAYGIAPFDVGYGRSILYVDQMGILLNQLNYSEGSDIQQVDYSDSVYPIACGYVSACGNGNYPILLWMDENFSEDFRIEYQMLFSDTSQAYFYSSCSTSNFDIVSAGLRVYDLIPEVPGDNYANLILTRHDDQGNEVWFHEYAAADIGVTQDYGGPFIIPRGGVFELSNGQIIVFGMVGNPLDCYAFKFDSEGNYIDHTKWGHNEYSDGPSWPVRISENEFLFAYRQHSTGDFEFDIWKPRVGRINTDDMSVDLFPLIEFLTEYGGITDFEKTADGDFIMLGWGAPDEQGEITYAYLIKVNSEGELIWAKNYFPPDLSYDLNAYDLELTSDGGFAFVGNYRADGDWIYKTWVVKTDACGEEVFNGCEPVIGVEETKNSFGQPFLIYPNPVAGLLNVESKELIERVFIKDITGKIVFSETMSARRTQLEITRIAQGLYLLEADIGNGKVMAQKIVIE